MHLAAGSFLRDYKIEKLLGKGGMGTVYLAKDSFLDRYVAIKELSPLLTADAGLVERFRNEARMQAKLNHAGIVSLHSFFEQNGRYYMVMEYASGRTLKDIIRQTGPIPEARALKILKQAVSALEYAHEMGIVHRDIKPSNIILDDNDRVKILDFGIARIMGERGLTQTGQQLGTVAYMSPEQVQAEKDIDGKTDIYSLGVTFFEMLSGRMPYDLNTESDFMVMNKIVHDTLPDPRNYYPHISDETIRLLEKMTQKDRHKRADIAELGSFFNGGVHISTPMMQEAANASNDVGKNKGEISNIDSTEPPAKKNNKEVKIFIAILVTVIMIILFFFLIPNKQHQRYSYNNYIDEVEEIDEMPEEAVDYSPIDLIFVEGGTFWMGSNDGWADERPMHEVTVSSFLIGRYEIRQKDWLGIFDSNPSTFKGDNLPVESVSWYDAVAFCNLLSAREGLTPCYGGSGVNTYCNWDADGYRLPTEAEWEYAALGGKKARGYQYAGSNTIGSVAWYDDNSDEKTHAVGQIYSNELGISDMSGNVSEWCWDWHDESYYSSSPAKDPRGPAKGETRIMRGGSWYNDSDICRTTYRGVGKADGLFTNVGFRIVRVLR